MAEWEEQGSTRFSLRHNNSLLAANKDDEREISSSSFFRTNFIFCEFLAEFHSTPHTTDNSSSFFLAWAFPSDVVLSQRARKPLRWWWWCRVRSELQDVEWLDILTQDHERSWKEKVGNSCSVCCLFFCTRKKNVSIKSIKGTSHVKCEQIFS